MQGRNPAASPGTEWDVRTCRHSRQQRSVGDVGTLSRRPDARGVNAMISTWKVTIHLFDADDMRPTTTARAVLTTAATTLVATGHARRRPDDPDIPEIGDELAAARALRALADQLLEATSGDISAIEHHAVHVPA